MAMAGAAASVSPAGEREGLVAQMQRHRQGLRQTATTSPQNEIKRSFPSVLICTRSCRISASTSTNERQYNETHNATVTRKASRQRADGRGRRIGVAWKAARQGLDSVEGQAEVDRQVGVDIRPHPCRRCSSQQRLPLGWRKIRKY